MLHRVISGLMLMSFFAVPSYAGAALIPEADRLRMPVIAAAQADRVVIGRMGKAEPDPVKARPTPDSTHQLAYRVYRLAVSETLRGEKAVSEVRMWGEILGNPPPPPSAEPSQNPNPIERDAEGLYFLALHHTGEFYSPIYFVPSYWKDNYVRDVAQARHHLALLADPIASLRGKKPEDRLATAVMMLMRYQAYRGQKWKPIPDIENESILAALSEVEWGNDEDSPMNPARFVRAVWRQSEVRGMESAKVFVEPVIPAKTRAEESAFLRAWLRRSRDVIRIERSAIE